MPMQIPTLNTWLRETNRGVFQMRDKLLVDIDKTLQEYNQAVSDYSRGWYAGDLRMCLDIWKKAQGPGDEWEEHPRNKQMVFSILDRELCLGGFPSKRYTQDSPMACNTRQGVLHFLSQSRVSNVPNNMLDLLYETNEQRKSVESAVKTVANDKSSNGNELVDAGKSFLEKLYEALKDFLSGLVDRISEATGKLAALAKAAVTQLCNYLPELLKELLGAILPQLGSVVKIAKNLKDATKAAWKYYSTADLERGVCSGHPQLIINSVRKHIRKKAKDKLEAGFVEAVKAGIGIANPLAGTIVSAIVSIYKYLKGIYDSLL
jgi:hypothetical protein